MAKDEPITTTSLEVSAAPNVVEFKTSEERDRMAEIRQLSSVLIDRYQFARQAGITFDGGRDLYQLFGYTRVLTTADYCDRYARGGLAKKLVECLPKASWRGGVEVIEDQDPEVSTPFELAAETLNTNLNAHAYLERADVLSQLGFYSVLLIGEKEGNLSEELPKGNGSPEGLVYFQPYAGGGGPGVGVGGFNKRTGVGSVAAFGDATIMTFDTDVKSKRFGQPMFYQLRRSDIASAAFTTQVHWSRIIHLADGCLDNDVYGVPSLECVWNLLDDLDKVTGGGSESYFQKAKAGLHVDIDKTMGLPGQGAAVSTPELTKLRNNLEEYKHELTTLITTRGTTVKELGGTPSDFSSEADAIITQVAGTKGIPKRVLTGSEMGELASSQDRENWRDTVNGRQSSYVGPYVVRRFYDRLIEYNYLPKPKTYQVKFAHIQILTEQEKADGAQKWASVNSTQGAVVFTENQIREHWYQMDPLTPEEEGDGLNQLDKARGASLWASVNKFMGTTVFSDDEIRQHWEQMAPLPEDQKKPIAAPERFSGQVGKDNKAIGKLQSSAPSKAVVPSVLSALEAAIELGKTSLAGDGLKVAMASGDTHTMRALLKNAADVVTKTLKGSLYERD